MRKRTIPSAGFLLLLIIAGYQACSGRPPAADSSAADLLTLRKDRDQAFRANAQSPIPPADRAQFAGLAYYPPDPRFRFQVRLNRYQKPELMQIITNTGEVRSGLKYGFFEFRVDGQPCRLDVYRLDEETSSGKAFLFIPFRDATTGKETYSGGRYLDLPENTSGNYVLDFNLAYNPYCAYGGDFSCPVPPDANRLAVAIQAGEKKYPLANK